MPKLRCSTNMEEEKNKTIRRTTKRYKFKRENTMEQRERDNSKIIDLQVYRAVIDAIKALGKFEKHGSREDFGKWLKKYNKTED